MTQFSICDWRFAIGRERSAQGKPLSGIEELEML